PRYMSPEQVRGHAVDTRSDLYSCGVIFYELLTGDAPFRAASVAELIAKLLYDTPPVLPDRFPQLLRETVQRLLMKDPAQRFVDAHEFDHALEQCETESRAGAGAEAALDSTMQSGQGAAPITREGPRSLNPDVRSGQSRVGRGDMAHGETLASGQTPAAGGAGAGAGSAAGPP